jgi:hypothetical protein
VGFLLLIGGVIAIGIFWLIKEQNTEMVTIDVVSVLDWGMMSEAMLIDIGQQVQRSLQDKERKLLARNPANASPYLYWKNADISRITGYLSARIPEATNDVELVKAKELGLLYEFRGPTSIENPQIETMYVTVNVRVVHQDPVEFKIKKYEEQTVMLTFGCYICPSYAFEDCEFLGECQWIKVQ